MISDFRLKEWRTYRAKIVQAHGALHRVQLARREIICWEFMARLERNCADLIEYAHSAKNVPGQFRYFVDQIEMQLKRSADLTRDSLTRRQIEEEAATTEVML